MTEKITGTVYKILFNNNETGYTVLKIDTKNGMISATGNLPNIKSGQELIIEGQWIIHPKFGKQFNIQSSTTAAPQTKAGLIKFLGSGLIKGIGESFAETIVEYLGMQALDIIENNPEKLEGIPGIGQKRAASIQESLHENKAISNLMIFLQSKDIGTGLATKIYKHYKQESLAVIQQNPYRLIDDLWGVGFKTADSLALKIGIKPFAQERVKAGISYTITDSLSQGNLYVEAESLKLRVLTILEIGEDHTEKIRQALQEMHSEGILKFITHKNKHYLTLHKFLVLEQNIADIIKSRLGYREAEITEIYESLKKTNLNTEQQKSIINAFSNSFTVITGGPGTGKTTLVRELLKLLEKLNKNYLLAAPTGRAAKRLIESTGRFASTIHRLLEFDVSIMKFKHDEKNPLKGEFIIIDEASMIDVFLMHSLLKALPKNCHVILIGDIDQLPSVGPGNILSDIIESQIIPTTKLNFIFRQAEGSMIKNNAHKVNKGEFIKSGDDFIFIKEDDPEKNLPTS